MQYRTLGDSDLTVSAVGLGTMTFGEQNSESEAHAQLDMAIGNHVNFIDTAEMYPVPPCGATQGRTESYIGNWLHRRRNREDVVLATKVSGPSTGMDYLRNGKTRLDRENIEQALNASLKRLRTDYVDLYQVHWPDRPTNYFGQLGYRHEKDKGSVPLEETLQALNDLVTAGKVRYLGVSNETPWGLMKYLSIAAQHDLARIISIQNPFNLLNRTFEVGLAEIAHRENVSLLAYSPLGFGVLSGKYLNGARPAGSRLKLFSRFSRYSNREGESATAAYVELARKHGLNPAQMALAFVNSRPFTGSNIVGATNLEQLRLNLASIDVTLAPDVVAEIEAIHQQQPNPCP